MLLGSKKPKLGGYASLGGAYTRMLDRDGGLVSLEGALLFDHRFSIGLAGYAFTETPDGPSARDGSDRDFATLYGGVAARYAVFTPAPIYFTLGVVVGGGAISLYNDDYENCRFGCDEDDEDWRERNTETDAYFVLQPEVTMHVNLVRWMRLGVTGGYRITSGVERFGFEESDLNGLSLGGNVQIGWF